MLGIMQVDHRWDLLAIASMNSEPVNATHPRIVYPFERGPVKMNFSMFTHVGEDRSRDGFLGGLR